MIEVKRLEEKALWFRRRAGWLESSNTQARLYDTADKCAAEGAARRLRLARA